MKVGSAYSNGKPALLKQAKTGKKKPENIENMLQEEESESSEDELDELPR